jgi:hypothetical protein
MLMAILSFLQMDPMVTIMNYALVMLQLFGVPHEDAVRS